MMHTRVMLIVSLLVLALSREARSEIPCIQAITSLIPCQPFLIGSSSSVTVPCCEGVTSLGNAANSDRAKLKSLCYCLKQAGSALGVNTSHAQKLPQLCSVSVPVPIDPSINCDSL